jgi:hypothetical protein
MSQNYPTDPLTNSKWEKFAQLVASGKSETDAYYESYKVKNKMGAMANGHRLMKNAIVRARIEFLQSENASKCAISREEAMNILADIARNADSSRDKISAVAELNKMNGWNKDKEQTSVADSIVINLGTFLSK